MRNPLNMNSTQNLLHTLTSKTYLTSTTLKEVLHSCGIRGRASPNMTRRITILGLALTSSRRSLRNISTICQLCMREIHHYQWMGLFSDPTFKVLDFLRAQTLGKQVGHLAFLHLHLDCSWQFSCISSLIFIFLYLHY